MRVPVAQEEIYIKRHHKTSMNVTAVANANGETSFYLRSTGTGEEEINILAPTFGSRATQRQTTEVRRPACGITI